MVADFVRYRKSNDTFATIVENDHQSTMTLELRWLRSFLAVAEENHFSRAARRLNLAQPALTTHIQRLEEEVGATLFERSNRMGGLTPAGRALLPEAESIVRRAEGLARIAREAASGETGVLRLGLIPPAATAGVAEALCRITRSAAGLAVEVQQGNQDRLENRLIDGDLDLILGRPPENASLAHRCLLVERQGVLLRTDDPLARRGRVALRDLEGRRLVLLRSNPYFGQNFLDLARAHAVWLDASHAADDFPSLHWMVLAGVGVAPCSLLLSGTLAAGLTAKPVSPPLPRLEIHAVWRGRVPPPAAVRWLKAIGELPS